MLGNSALLAVHEVPEGTGKKGDHWRTYPNVSRRKLSYLLWLL